MEGLGRAKQDARVEGNAGAIAEVHREAQGRAIYPDACQADQRCHIGDDLYCMVKTSRLL